jgi:hypothetical protein
MTSHARWNVEDIRVLKKMVSLSFKPTLIAERLNNKFTLSQIKHMIKNLPTKF